MIPLQSCQCRKLKECIAFRGTALPSEISCCMALPSTFRSFKPQVLGLTLLEQFGGKMQNSSCSTAGTNCITSSRISPQLGLDTTTPQLCQCLLCLQDQHRSDKFLTCTRPAPAELCPGLLSLHAVRLPTPTPLSRTNHWFANSSLPTVPVPFNPLKSIMGTNANNIHARSSATSSLISLRVDPSSNAVLTLLR